MNTPESVFHFIGLTSIFVLIFGFGGLEIAFNSPDAFPGMSSTPEQDFNRHTLEAIVAIVGFGSLYTAAFLSQRKQAAQVTE